MNRIKHLNLTLLICLALFLAACQPILPVAKNQDAIHTASQLIEQKEEASLTPTAFATKTQEPTQGELSTAEPDEEEEAIENTAEIPETSLDLEPTLSEKVEIPVELSAVGPEEYPQGINPLTGLPANNPDFLTLPPALVSVSNFPASARPQAGLSASPIVFEMAIGYGMTRFLAVFYGDYPGSVSKQTEDPSNHNEADEQIADESAAIEPATIGPIRSGRLPYEDLRKSYSGFLVMASADKSVAATMSQTTSIYGSDSDDINSALMNVDHLQMLATSRVEHFPGTKIFLGGMMFTKQPPAGGQLADKVWVFYSHLNQIQWQYDNDKQAYIRYDITTDGSDEFVMETDRLTGEPLSKENVIVIYAEHDYQAPTLINIDLVNKPPMPALLFRDGEVHEIFWTTQFGDHERETLSLRPIRFVDREGNPIGLKPGQTWVHFVSTDSYHAESALRDNPFLPIIEEPGSGLWLIRYKGKY